jgi:hypothetical protein
MVADAISSCDVLASSAIEDAREEDALETLRRSWQEVARYRLVRSEPGRRVVLSTGKDYAEALRLCEAATAALRQEPGYRDYVMSRPLILIELEDPELTRVRYRTLMNARRAA